MKSCLLALFTGAILFGTSGCMHVISSEGRAEVNSDTPFSALYAAPEEHLGERLLVGGLILSVKEDEATTTLEVLAYTLDGSGEPLDFDDSGERFLVRTADQRNLPFDAGLLVTLTGTVAGSETVALIGRDYTYPLLLMHEVHLWEEPFRRGLVPGQDLNTPFYQRPPQPAGHENPYDPGYAPFPYTPYYYHE